MFSTFSPLAAGVLTLAAAAEGGIRPSGYKTRYTSAFRGILYLTSFFLRD